MIDDPIHLGMLRDDSQYEDLRNALNQGAENADESLTFKSGEKTVVGVSKMDGGDKGLILIISGKEIKLGK